VTAVMWVSALLPFGIVAVLIFILLRSSRGTVSSDVCASTTPRTIPIDIQDNPELLLATMRAFESSGQISFEGVKRDSALRNLAGATHVQSGALRRHSLGTSADFVVIPLTSENIDAISKLINWAPDDDWDPDTERDVPNGRMSTGSFFHVQVASDNRLAFGAYDNFHRDCVFATEKFPVELLDRLVANGVIRSYAVDADAEPIVVGKTSVPP
jgi:hypothetical protein